MNEFTYGNDDGYVSNGKYEVSISGGDVEVDWSDQELKDFLFDEARADFENNRTHIYISEDEQERFVKWARAMTSDEEQS